MGSKDKQNNHVEDAMWTCEMVTISILSSNLWNETFRIVTHMVLSINFLVTDRSSHYYFLQCIQFLSHLFEYGEHTLLLYVLGEDCQTHIRRGRPNFLLIRFYFYRWLWHNKTDALRWCSGHSTRWLSWRQRGPFCLQGFRWILGTPGSGELGLNRL